LKLGEKKVLRDALDLGVIINASYSQTKKKTNQTFAVAGTIIVLAGTKCWNL